MRKMTTRYQTKMRVIPKVSLDKRMMDPKEDDVQQEVVRALLGTKKVSFFHSIPNEARGRSKGTQGKLVSMGLVAGVADLFIWWSDGTYGYMEVKTRKSKLSQKQMEFKKRCEKRGIEYSVVRSGKDVFKIARGHSYPFTSLKENGDGENIH